MMKSLLQRCARFSVEEKDVLLVFFASRLVLWAVAWLAVNSFVPGRPGVQPHSLLWDILFRWDANWYARVTNLGYSYKPGVESDVAFFPLLPLLAGTVRQVTGMRLELAGFLVSNTALVASAVLLRRLATLDFPAPSRVPRRAVWLLLFCPMTFFHSAFYTESLFLLLSLCVLLFARRRRWLAVGLAAGLLGATHGHAFLIGLPVLWEMFFAPAEPGEQRRSRWERSFWWVLLAPSGLILYATYLHFHVGDALAFGHAEAAWHRSLGAPGIGLWNVLGDLPPVRALYLGAAVIALALCGVGYWMRLRVSYQIYAAATVLFLFSNTILHGMPRVLSVIFPFYLALAALGERSENAFLCVLASSAAVMAVCAALFVSGYPLV